MSQVFGNAASAVHFTLRYHSIADQRSCPECGNAMKLWRSKCTDSIKVRITIRFVLVQLRVCVPCALGATITEKEVLFPIFCSRAHFTKVQQFKGKLFLWHNFNFSGTAPRRGERQLRVEGGGGRGSVRGRGFDGALSTRQ